MKSANLTRQIVRQEHKLVCTSRTHAKKYLRVLACCALALRRLLISSALPRVHVHVHSLNPAVSLSLSDIDARLDRLRLTPSRENLLHVNQTVDELTQARNSARTGHLLGAGNFPPTACDLPSLLLPHPLITFSISPSPITSPALHFYASAHVYSGRCGKYRDPTKTSHQLELPP
jgi:hypothetical protein